MDRIPYTKKELFAAEAFFNAIPDQLFVKMINAIANGVGAGYEECICEFYEEGAGFDEPFDGAEFSMCSSSVILTEGCT